MENDLILELAEQDTTEEVCDMSVIFGNSDETQQDTDIQVLDSFEGIEIEAITPETFEPQKVIMNSAEVKTEQTINDLEWSDTIDTYVKTIDGGKGVRSRDYDTILTEIPAKWLGCAIQIPTSIILIDIDDIIQGECLVKILKAKGLFETTRIMKTTKGYHFYFKHTCWTNQYRDWVNALTSIGIICDVKSGLNTKHMKATGEEHPNYAVVKKDGVMRTWVNDIPFSECEPFPAWLHVCPSNSKSNYQSLCGMGEGDGRQQALFEHVGRLVAKGIPKDAIKQSCAIVNEYVFAEPLPPNEYENAVREEAFQGAEQFSQQIQDIAELIPPHDILVSNGYRFKQGRRIVLAYEELARDVALSYKMVFHLGELYIYEKNRYQVIDEDDINSLVRQMIITSQKVTSSEMKELLHSLKSAQNVKYPDGMFFRVENKPELLALDNGLLNTITKEIQPLTDEYFVTRGLNGVQYRPEVTTCEAVDKVLDNVFQGNTAMIDAFWEWVGYTLTNNQKYNKCLLMTGGGSNGKSTIINMLRDFYGHENTGSVGYDEISKDFQLTGIQNKLVNIDADVSNESRIDNASKFKKMTGEDTVRVNRKFQDPVDVKINTKFMFACNGFPKTNDLSKGFFRRWLVLPFNANFDVEQVDFDPNISEKISTSTSKSYILNMALEGLDRLNKNKQFTSCEEMEQALRRLKATNDNVIEWIENEGFTCEYFLYEGLTNGALTTSSEKAPDLLSALNVDSAIKGLVKGYYMDYTRWCEENRCSPCKKTNFVTRLSQHFKITTKRIINSQTDGKKVEVFTN